MLKNAIGLLLLQHLWFQYRHRGFGLAYTSRSKLLYPCSKLTRSKLCPAQSCCSSISMSPGLDPCATVALHFPGYMFYSGWLKSTQKHVFVFSLCSSITNNLIQVVTSCRYPPFLYMTSICYKVYWKATEKVNYWIKKVYQVSLR